MASLGKTKKAEPTGPERVAREQELLADIARLEDAVAAAEERGWFAADEKTMARAQAKIAEARGTLSEAQRRLRAHRATAPEQVELALRLPSDLAALKVTVEARAQADATLRSIGVAVDHLNPPWEKPREEVLELSRRRRAVGESGAARAAIEACVPQRLTLEVSRHTADAGRLDFSLRRARSDLAQLRAQVELARKNPNHARVSAEEFFAEIAEASALTKKLEGELATSRKAEQEARAAVEAAIAALMEGRIT